MGKNSILHLTYSAIPDNGDKVLISHPSNIFTRDQVSNPTSRVRNLSVSKKVALLHMRCAGSWNASDLSRRQSRIQRYLTCYVQQRHLVETQRHRPLFLPAGGDRTHFICLQLVHRICSAGNKFRLMTIKLLYASSDKSRPCEDISAIFNVTYDYYCYYML